MGAEIAIVGAFLSAAGTAYGAYAQNKAARSEARLAQEQASMEQEAAGAEAANIRERGKRLIGAQRAALAASGVKIDEGSGDALQSETRRLSEQDALAVLKEGHNRSSLLRGQAKIANQRATAATVGGVLSTTGELVNAAQKVKGAGGGGAREGTPATGFKLNSDAQDFARRYAPKFSLLDGKNPYSL